MGNFKIEERAQKKALTAYIEGKFDGACQAMTGYFSKMDGSDLLPFEFLEVRPPGAAQEQGTDTSHR